jgi:hypothetical protein|tara:strand:- start:431 stop:898 length:468 start_codon:yes stop_codon:yes gene_type:complete
MAEIDDRAFDNMRRATDRAPDRMFEGGRLFTESEYNTSATDKERKGYDSEAYFLLKDLYSEDRKKDRFQTFNFSEYLQNLDRKYLEEKFLHSKKGDPEYYGKAGNLLRDVYGGDVEQLKLSASNVHASIGTPEQTRDFRADRSNVSIKAPEAEKY